MSCRPCPAVLALTLPLLLTSPLPAAERADPVTPQQVRQAVERGVALLERDGLRWKNERNCISCHHVGMAIYCLSEAKRQGFAVKQESVRELAQWALNINEKADTPLHLTPGLALAPPADDVTAAGFKDQGGHVLEEQQADGSWQMKRSGGRSIFGDTEVITLQVLRTLAAAPDAAGDAWPKSRDRALAWLKDAEPGDTTQALAFRVLARVQLGKADDAGPLVKDLLARQNADGGWGAAPGRPSDALATGEALVALGTAGGTGPDAAVQRAWTYLVRTQNADGSWVLRFRPLSGKDFYIFSYYGSGWATMGLAASLPGQADGKESAPSAPGAEKSDANGGVKPLGEPLRHDGYVLGLGFSRDGKTLVSGSLTVKDPGALRLWDVATGKPVGEPLGKGSAPRPVAFAPDGKSILAAYTGKEIAGKPEGVGLALTVSPDGKVGLLGRSAKTALRWDVATGQPVGPPLQHQDVVAAVAFSPDGKVVLTGSDDQTARLWDAATGQSLGVLRHEGAVTAVAFGPDGTTLATGGWDKTARLWQAPSLEK